MGTKCWDRSLARSCDGGRTQFTGDIAATLAERVEAAGPLISGDGMRLQDPQRFQLAGQ